MFRLSALTLPLCLAAATLTAAAQDTPPQRIRTPSPASRPAATPADENGVVERMMQADVNKDGTVSRDEVERVDSDLARRFKAADRNRDGQLTLQEYERLRALSKGSTAGSASGGSAGGSGPATGRR